MRAGNERYGLCSNAIMSEVNDRRNGMKYSTSGGDKEYNMRL